MLMTTITVDSVELTIMQTMVKNSVYVRACRVMGRERAAWRRG